MQGLKIKTGSSQHITAYMAVLLGLSGSKVMISMWIRPDWIKKKKGKCRFILRADIIESILVLSHQVLIIFKMFEY